MASVTIDIKLRPIKLAFLVDPKDKTALREAIEINTFLWGGSFNPIIPFFKRIPRSWQDRLNKDLNSRQILAGYLDAYDPDYIVPIGKAADFTYHKGNKKIVAASEILTGVEKEGTPKYGIGLFEIVRYFANKELKFLRREPLDMCLPNLGENFDVFMASVFGLLRQDIDKMFFDNFADVLEKSKMPSSISNYAELLTPRKPFLRRFSSLYLQPYRRGWWGGQCAFFLDANSTSDIIDYWNLRAVGWNVLPVPKQVSGLDSTKKSVCDFIERNYHPIYSNPKIYRNTILLKSRSTSEDELKEFAKSLKISPSDKGSKTKFLLQHSYPRIWDEWARDKDHAECCELESRTIRHDLHDYQGTISFRTLDPEFINRFGGFGEARFANEMKLRTYETTEILAEVIPEGDENLIRTVGGSDFKEWRFSKKGIVYLSPFSSGYVRISLPKAENVFAEWLKSQKWEIKLSPSGHIAKQMIKQLGGPWGISVLANEGIIQLLKIMTGDKTIKKDSFWAEISKIANQEKFIKDPNGLLQTLINTKMFRLGVELQCPVCRQHSWYTIKDLDYELQCLKCLERFQIPSHSPKEIEWSYRTFGPFSLPKQAYGVYSVLLTLRFFSRQLQAATTPILSFIAKRDNEREIEVDLALFFREFASRDSDTKLIFCECKTYDEFNRKDIDRASVLSDNFPGAVLVFATFRKEFTKNEKLLLSRVVNRGRKYWKAEHPLNPVLILTSAELFARWSPPMCWKDLGEKHSHFADVYHGWIDLLKLCDATQQLYLDMKPWYQWLEERWEKRRKKRTEPSKQEIISHENL
jgi:hypothetical protein